MALQESFAASGNWLFRRRSYLPVVLYAAAVPVAYFSAGVGELGSPNYLDPRWWGLCLALSFLGMFIRALAIGFAPKGTSGRNTSEGQVAESLNTEGIYSLVRHPLYLGNYFMWIGIVCFAGSAWFVLAVSLVFWLYYERIMFAEEAFLRGKFGQAYLNWSDHTPAFFPRFTGWESPRVKFSMRNVLKREYNGFFAIFLSFALLDAVHVARVMGVGEETHWLSDHWKAGLVGAAFVFLVLRTLKKHTRILDVDGREYSA